MWGHTGKQRPDFAVTPAAGQESVWDYPRPPAIRRTDRLVEVNQREIQIARTRHALRVLETASPPTYYIPADDVALNYLVQVDGSSFCEWKGKASYWGFKDDPSVAVGWSYPTPNAPFERLADCMAFYPGRIACFVDGERVQAQAGGFYGGWITSDIVGPFKGEPGTGHW